VDGRVTALLFTGNHSNNAKQHQRYKQRHLHYICDLEAHTAVSDCCNRQSTVAPNLAPWQDLHVKIDRNEAEEAQIGQSRLHLLASVG
jgi:hypothetical protein